MTKQTLARSNKRLLPMGAKDPSASNSHIENPLWQLETNAQSNKSFMALRLIKSSLNFGSTSQIMNKHVLMSTVLTQQWPKIRRLPQSLH